MEDLTPKAGVIFYPLIRRVWPLAAKLLLLSFNYGIQFNFKEIIIYNWNFVSYIIFLYFLTFFVQAVIIFRFLNYASVEYCID